MNLPTQQPEGAEAPERAPRTELANQIGSIWTKQKVAASWGCRSYEPANCDFCHKVWQTENLLRQREDEAYARGWTQRDNDYQAIGEKPPEQEAAKRAVEFARAIKKETLSMSARDSMARTPGGETEYFQGYLMGLDDAARSIDRIVDNYLGALPPTPELSEQEQKARLKRAGKAAKKLKEIEEANET